MNQSETNGYIQGERGALYASLHTPAEAITSQVLMLPPFGEERKCAYRLLVLLARQLAEAGCRVLRFDPSGTGESAGELAALRLEDWQDDATRLLTLLADHEAPVYLLGARLGANLSSRLIHQRIAGRLLLEPLLTGESYLQEMMRRKQVKEMMSGGQAASASERCQGEWERGEAVDFDGFPIGSGLAADLQGLDLMADLETLSDPLLVLHVSGARRLSGGWANLEAHCASHQEQYLDLVREKPFWGRLDYYESEELPERVQRFLAGPAKYKDTVSA